jgi:protein gp37
MSQATAIEWTDVSWNPVHGCSKVSPGCAHCYAETLSLRYGQTAKPWTPANAAENVTLKPHKLREPLSKRKPYDRPCRVFVNSMSDLFHEQVPDEYIGRVFGVMASAPQHTFQVLTKRPERMRDVIRASSWEWSSEFADGWRDTAPSAAAGWPLPNVWLGTSIENRRFVGRADLLRETPAAVRFISAEPLIGPLVARFEPDGELGEWVWPDGTVHDGNDMPGLNLDGIDWLIVGGESGPGHRPMREEWARDLRDTAQAAGTAFFLKQWGGARPGGEALLDGREWREFPKREVAA